MGFIMFVCLSPFYFFFSCIFFSFLFLFHLLDVRVDISDRKLRKYESEAHRRQLDYSLSLEFLINRFHSSQGMDKTTWKKVSKRMLTAQNGTFRNSHRDQTGWKGVKGLGR